MAATISRSVDALTLPSDTNFLSVDGSTRPSDAFSLPVDSSSLASDTFTLSVDSSSLASDTFSLSVDSSSLASDTFTLSVDSFTRPSDTFTLSVDSSTRPFDTLVTPRCSFCHQRDCSCNCVCKMITLTLQTMEEKEKAASFSYEEFEKEAIKGLYERKRLSGEDGVFAPLLKHFLEKALALELEQHLKGSEGNKRNGVTSKTVKSSNGEFELSTPRDRNGTFTPEIVAKRQVVLDDELCDKVLSLYAKGMSYADIRKMLMEVYGLSLSPAQMSEITDRLIPELQEWQQRPLNQLYAMVWFDAIHFKCRDNGAVQGKALYNVYAVSHEGFRELLGIYIAES